MKRFLPILVVAAALGTAVPDAQAGKFRDSFAGRTLAALINRVPQRATTKRAAPAAKAGVMAKLRAWAAAPPEAKAPQATNSVKAAPKLAFKNGGFKSNLQARWNSFKQSSMGQRMQSWRAGFSSFLGKLRSPRQIFRMSRRDTLKTAQAAALQNPSLWQKAQAIVRTKGRANVDALKRQLKMFGFLSRQENRRNLAALSDAAQMHNF